MDESDLSLSELIGTDDSERAIQEFKEYSELKAIAKKRLTSKKKLR